MSEQSFDVLVLVPTMATPPSEIAALAASVNLPVVILCGHELDSIDAQYNMEELCRHSTNVGASMFGSMLRRLDNPIKPILVSGFIGDTNFHERARLAVRAAATAARIKGLKVGRLGQPMTGYDHLGLNDEQAAASGLKIVDFSLEEWEAIVSDISPAEIDFAVDKVLQDILPAHAKFSRSVELKRAMRLALALDKVATQNSLDCGAISCRGAFGVDLENGAISCLATTLLAKTGRPFAATGDMVTAVAMLIGRSLGGAVLYCELDAVDRERNAFLVANTGEADIDWCPQNGEFEIIDASEHSGRLVPGVVLRHSLASGLATMVGVTLDRTRSEKLTLIALEGRTLGQTKTALKVTNGWFQPDKFQAISAFEAWANAGATHHGALSPGALAEAINWIAMVGDFPVSTITNTGIRHDR